MVPRPRSFEPSPLLNRLCTHLRPDANKPVLDAPCGFGRHTFALAQRGFTIVAVDKSLDCLTATHRAEPLGDGQNRTGNSVIHTVCADLESELLPFRPSSFGAIVCVHYPLRSIIPKFVDLLEPGGCLLIETFGGQGRNYLDLPKSGELRSALQGFDLPHYRERRVGPPEFDAVVVQAIGRKSIAAREIA